MAGHSSTHPWPSTRERISPKEKEWQGVPLLYLAEGQVMRAGRRSLPIPCRRPGGAGEAPVSSGPEGAVIASGRQLAPLRILPVFGPRRQPSRGRHFGPASVDSTARRRRHGADLQIRQPGSTGCKEGRHSIRAAPPPVRAVEPRELRAKIGRAGCRRRAKKLAKLDLRTKPKM